MMTIARRILSLLPKGGPESRSGADGERPAIPAETQSRFAETLLRELSDQRRGGVRNGLYEAVIVSFVFNHERIEGNSSTEAETRGIFETRDLVLADGTAPGEKRETANHTLMFDRLLDSIGDPLDEDLIKGLHLSLMGGVMETPGEWKVNPNGVGGVATVRPEDVPEAIAALLAAYGRHAPTLDNITRFHVRYETIHPFPDGNGRTGRAIMFRECLRAGLIPFIVTDRTKDRYYAALDSFRRGENSLLGYALDMQVDFLRLALPLLSDRELAEELAGYVPGLELAPPVDTPDDYFTGAVTLDALQACDTRSGLSRGSAEAPGHTER